jgi:hypothetical protein
VVRGLIGVAMIVVLAGCSSTRSEPPETRIVQGHEIKCVASNVTPSGCKTTHELGVIFDFTADPSAVPPIDRFKVDGADESEF